MARPSPDSGFRHPSALIESAEIGEGTRVWAFAHVMSGARVGADCNVGESVFIEAGAVVGDRCTVKNGVQLWSGVTLEDDVFVGPNATFTNDLWPRSRKPMPQPVPTVVRQGASIGANATVLAGRTVGPYALVGAGAVVVSDIAPHALIVGNPGRQVGWVCQCGPKLDASLQCAECGSSYQTVDGGIRKLES